MTSSECPWVPLPEQLALNLIEGSLHLHLQPESLCYTISKSILVSLLRLQLFLITGDSNETITNRALAVELFSAHR